MKPPAAEPIEFIDLARQQKIIRTSIDAAIARVLCHGRYILGPEVAAFEAELSAFCGARHAITCANGTDALSLVLMAKDIGTGHAVFVPSFTFAATAEVVAGRGATPVFIDSLPDTFNMDPASLKQGIADAHRAGLTPRVVIPVDLFGLPADYDAIEPIAAENDLFVLCDAAQSFGARYKGRDIGSIGHATATSFFPAKPLGCYGDGGAMFTQDDKLATVLRSLRVHGKGSDKYDNVRVGLNSRLDTLQAAILIEKLAIFAQEIEARNRIAARYDAALAALVDAPFVPHDLVSVWAQYTIRVPPSRRDFLIARLKDGGVPTAIYYAKPLHLQTAYRDFPQAGGALPRAERTAREVLSLPLHPYLDKATQDRVIAAVIHGLERNRD
jgi:dTDP-4-amino-4,6-dideoxygalactose transaminase